jgi:hypothetical protein
VLTFHNGQIRGVVLGVPCYGLPNCYERRPISAQEGRDHPITPLLSWELFFVQRRKILGQCTYSEVQYPPAADKSGTARVTDSDDGQACQCRPCGCFAKLPRTRIRPVWIAPGSTAFADM